MAKLEDLIQRVVEKTLQYTSYDVDHSELNRLQAHDSEAERQRIRDEYLNNTGTVSFDDFKRVYTTGIDDSYWEHMAVALDAKVNASEKGEQEETTEYLVNQVFEIRSAQKNEQDSLDYLVNVINEIRNRQIQQEEQEEAQQEEQSSTTSTSVDSSVRSSESIESNTKTIKETLEKQEKETQVSSDKDLEAASNIEGAVNKTTETQKKASSSIMRLLQSLFDLVADLFRKLFTEVGPIWLYAVLSIAALLDKAINGVMGFFGIDGSFSSNILGAIGSAVSTITGMIVKLMSFIPGVDKKALDSVARTAFSAGKSVEEGFEPVELTESGFTSKELEEEYQNWAFNPNPSKDVVDESATTTKLSRRYWQVLLPNLVAYSNPVLGGFLHKPLSVYGYAHGAELNKLTLDVINSAPTVVNKVLGTSLPTIPTNEVFKSSEEEQPATETVPNEGLTSLNESVGSATVPNVFSNTKTDITEINVYTQDSMVHMV